MKIYKTRFISRYVLNRYTTPKKLWNLTKALWAYAIKKEKLNHYPIKLVIDPCNICNLNCPLCPSGSKGRKLGKMKKMDYYRLIDEIGKYLYEIDLFNWGEPFLNKDIYGMIAVANYNKIRTRISSNLNTEIDAEKLVKSGLDVLIVSLDGTTQETYQKYRKGGDINKVYENVRNIVDAKRKLKSKTPKLVWQFIKFKHNFNEVVEAFATAENHGFDYIKIEKNRGYMDKEIFTEKKQSRKMCRFLWFQSVINHNGSVSPCCAVYPEKYDFGNGFNDFKKVWNGFLYTNSRRLVTGKVAHKTICSECVKKGFIR